MKKKFLLIISIPILFPWACNQPNHYDVKTNDSGRYKRGLERLTEIDGESGIEVIESLKDFSPDLGNYIVEYAFGDVYCRTGISDKERETIVVAALTALGNAEPQLKVHINAALNVGLEPQDIIQIINQTAPYAGIPASLNGIRCLREVLNDRGISYIEKEVPIPSQDPHSTGKKRLNSLYSGQTDSLKESLGEFSPGIIDYIIITYGTILDEEKLEPRLREMATVASLTALGTAQPQLQFHIEAAMNIGVTVEQIKEIMITMSVYAGFPASLNGISCLRTVLKSIE